MLYVFGTSQLAGPLPRRQLTSCVGRFAVNAVVDVNRYLLNPRFKSRAIANFVTEGSIRLDESLYGFTPGYPFRPVRSFHAVGPPKAVGLACCPSNAVVLRGGRTGCYKGHDETQAW